MEAGGGGVNHNIAVPQIFSVDFMIAAKAAQLHWRFDVGAATACAMKSTLSCLLRAV